MKAHTKYILFKIISLILLIALFNYTNVSAQQAKEDQQKLMMEKITELLGKYQQYGQFSKDGVQLDEDLIKEYLLLFEKTRFRGLYNDLAYSGGGNFSLPDDYISYIRTYYPQGLDQSLDLGNIRLVESSYIDGIYNVIVSVRKQLTGLYDQKKIHNFDGTLYFIIAVHDADLINISGYKISGVISQKKYSTLLSNRKSKGVYLGVTAGYEKSRIYSSSVYSSNLWSPKMGGSISPNLDITLMLTNGFGVGTGIRLSTYSTSFAINNYNKTSTNTMVDVDGDTYYPILQIPELTESNTINCYEIPLLIKTRVGKGSKKFFFDFGLVYSMISKSYFTLEGSSTIKGYYPQYFVTLKNLPEFGFGTFTYDPSTKNKMNLNKQLISAQVALGLSFSISNSFLLKVGTRVNYGLTDIGFNKVRHANDFNSTLETPLKTTVLQSLGVDISFTYKIF